MQGIFTADTDFRNWKGESMKVLLGKRVFNYGYFNFVLQSVNQYFLQHALVMLWIFIKRNIRKKKVISLI